MKGFNMKPPIFVRVQEGQRRRGLRVQESQGREDNINAKGASNLVIFKRDAQTQRYNLMKTFRNHLLLRRKRHSLLKNKKKSAVQRKTTRRRKPQKREQKKKCQFQRKTRRRE
ncbi:uncharacterized protein LOC120639517 isoform X2 [Panicum virgatum]|uniref:uncharacterized protein LOC120639517 isoform X2 n=1 Tax=Panicum virgatum TaxID=38727 RepID=UPI0019D60B94|nr:uncharacterized protein LOC120639517 isoform X2 [Panicum virgatum]